MEYRDLGKTGIRVSEIGLGCEGFLEKGRDYTLATLQYAREQGINCLDMYSPNPELRKYVGEALAGCRGSLVLQSHFCSVWKNGQYKATRELKEVQDGFETMLAELNTEYIDIGMIHYVDSLATWEQILRGGILDYAAAQKQAGRIRCIGLSSHNPEVALKALESGRIEVLMFSINPCYDLQPAGENVEDLWADERYEQQLTNMDPQREQLYETCQRQGVGITVMKAFGGGDLLDASLSPAGAALTVSQCLHYALTRPAVAAVMAGARSREELAAALAYETASAEERDYAAALASFPRISWQGHCMYCGHCAPCPAGIDIASVTKFLNLARAQGRVPETVREHYAALKSCGGDCIGCGACEKRCPFGVPVRGNMREAAGIFGR